MYYQQFLVIDYGTTYIKGVLFRDTFGTISILRSETLNLVSLSDGNEDEYEYNLVRFIQSFFPEENVFLLNIPTERIIIRSITVPLDKEKEIREVIPYEVENVIPFPMETIITRGSISKIEVENSKVITYSAHNDDVVMVVTPLAKNNSVIKAVYTDPFVLSCIIQNYYTTLITEERVGQLDIGGKVTIFNLCNDGKVAHSRYFAEGGYFITKAISKLLNTSVLEAEEIKKEIDFDFNQPEEPKKNLFIKKNRIKEEEFHKIIQIIKDSFNRIITEVTRSLMSIEPKNKPTSIFLSGGGSTFLGTEEYLTREIGIPVKFYDVPETKEGGFINKHYINCLGASFHRKLKKVEKIDFLNESISKKIQTGGFNFSKFKPHLILTSISLVILTAVFLTGIIIDQKKLKKNEEALKTKFAQSFGRELGADEDAMTAAIAERDKEKKKSEIVRLFLNKDGILDLMLEITNKYPSKESLDFVLDQFTYSGADVQIYGRVNEYSEIGTIQTSLEKSNKFRKIEISNKNLNQGVNKFKASFKIKLDLKSGSPEDEKEKNTKAKEE